MYNFHINAMGADDVNRIKELRTLRGWRQVDLAAILKTTPQAIGNYETGVRGLDVETICRLCEIFGVTADYLLGRSIQPGSPISDEEWQLLAAYRAADDDARALVRLALKRFAEPGEQEKDAVS